MRKLYFVIIFILLPISMLAKEEGQLSDYDKMLVDYDNADNKGKVSKANILMKFLLDRKFLDEAITFEDKEAIDNVNQQVWYWASEYYYSLQNYSSALTYGLKALPLCTKDEDKANCLNLISLTYFRQSKYEQAVDYAKQCYKIDEKSGDPNMMSSSLNSIAGIYIGANQPQEAEQYILKGIALAEKANNPTRMAVLQGMASEVYHALGNDEEALKYINESYRIEESLGNGYKMMVRLSQKSSVLIGMHEYEQAEELLNRVIPAFEQVGDKHSLGIACNKMGMTLLCQERQDEAVPYYRKAAEIFESMGDKGNEMHSRRGLYESLWDLNLDSAKIELTRFNDLKDLLYNMSSAESLARYNAEFGTELLQKENEHQKEIMVIVIIAGMVLLILFVGGVWLLMHRRMRVRELALKTIIEELQRETENNQAEETPSDVDLHEETMNKSDQELLSRLVSLVKQSMPTGDLSIESLASNLCITRGQLNRRIKSIAGVTTQQYVLRIRLEHSRILLRQESDTSISEIAYKCGFEDATSFSRAFRRTFGKSPSQYRTR